MVQCFSPVKPSPPLTMQSPAGYTLTATSPGVYTLQFRGSWKISETTPEPVEITRKLPAEINTLNIAADNSLQWDSILPVFLTPVVTYCSKNNITLNLNGLPEGINALLQLAAASPTRVRPEKDRQGFLYRLGQSVLQAIARGGDLIRFAGQIVIALALLVQGKAYFRFRDFWYFVQDCGAKALPIVSLISILVGVIMAFVGAVQLQLFGAQIYVANLVALSMVLEMGAMMSGVIIAGRTGASYAAQLGTMQVNEEIDALQTLGISPVSYLVLPRMLALFFMLPLLCVYADILGILGGSLIGMWMLDLSFMEYFHQTKKGLNLHQINQGLIKSAVYGVLIGYAGCYQGMHSGRSASAVGEATTAAVVMAIVLIVISDAIMTVIFSV